MEAFELLRMVVDPVRLAILGEAAQGGVDPQRLADRLGCDRKRVLQEIGKLRESGLLDDFENLQSDVLREVARSLKTSVEPDPSELDGPWSPEEARVLARFFEGARLTAIPTSRSKRLLVLERLVQEFEPGLRYQEREVNFTLQLFHADYAALRRYLVDEGLMTRADGVYWRTGGRFVDGLSDDEE